MPIKSINSAISEIEVGRTASVPRQLARQVREMIRSGKLEEGGKLPSNQRLSEMWQVGRASVQAAMASLVKEGLVRRAPKLGTFVARRTQSMTRVGIYVTENIWQKPYAAYRRALVGTLGDLLREKNLDADIWIDPRPRQDQARPWDELLRAIDQQRVHAVLLPDFTVRALPWIRRLQVPWVVFCPAIIPTNYVSFELGAGAQLAIKDLIRQGCRSAGMIGPMTTNSRSHNPSERQYANGIKSFNQCAAAAGLEVRNQWIQHSISKMVDEADSERFGYHGMKRLLAMSDRPQGVFVTHDWVARGAITAVLESKVKVPDDMKLVLHRNIEVGLLCPLKVSFLDFSVTAAATAMLRIIDAQVNGEDYKPVKLTPHISSAIKGA
jgi:DNA-binding LacI/PurR family transcriptional regulator